MENPLPPVIIERKAQSHEAGLELYRIDDTVKKQYSSPQRRSLAKDELRNCSKYATIRDYPELSVGSGANGLENATSWSGATWDRLNGPRTLLSRYTYREGRVTRSSCRFVREVQLGLKIENFHFCFNEGL